MAAQYYKINYKSDFVLTINSDAGWAVPFCIKFWTGMPSHGYFAGFDGENYVNCRVGETPTQLLVMFDDHHMPVGPLRMQIAYHTTIEEFPDRQFDEVTNPTNVTVDIDGTEYQVMLDFTGETGADIDFSMPSSGVMSVNGKIGYVTLTAEDVGAQPTIEDLATIRSGAAAGATAVQPAEMTAALATKQDTISDLATIRSGAAAGATAYQKPGTGIPASDLASGVQSSLQKADAAAPQSNTYTKGEVDTLIEGAISDIDVDDALSTTSENPVQNKVVTTALNGKQATISDLSTIRSGAAAGATAVQPAALTPIENDIDAIEAKIPSAASASNQLADKAFVNSALSGKADAADIPTALSQLSQDSTHRTVTDSEKSTWNGKQNAIDDLATIRSGAAAGATAVQPAAMNTALAAKQDTLTFDNTPTANSNNPVKSSGIKTALDAKQNTISTVNVSVDNNTGTPSGTASVSGSTLSLSFQNLKGATGATGATGPQGPQGERGLPGESGVTGDVSGFTVIQTIDPSATYGATDIAGAATVQATNAELTELGGELTEEMERNLELIVSPVSLATFNADDFLGATNDVVPTFGDNQVTLTFTQTANPYAYFATKKQLQSGKTYIVTFDIVSGSIATAANHKLGLYNNGSFTNNTSSASTASIQNGKFTMRAVLNGNADCIRVGLTYSSKTVVIKNLDIYEENAKEYVINNDIVKDLSSDNFDEETSHAVNASEQIITDYTPHNFFDSSKSEVYKSSDNVTVTNSNGQINILFTDTINPTVCFVSDLVSANGLVYKVSFKVAKGTISKAYLRSYLESNPSSGVQQAEFVGTNGVYEATFTTSSVSPVLKYTIDLRLVYSSKNVVLEDVCFFRADDLAKTVVKSSSIGSEYIKASFLYNTESSDCSILEIVGNTDNKVVMIDAGDSSATMKTSMWNALGRRNISHIDYFILSHWHSDHMGLITWLQSWGIIDGNTIFYLPTPPVASEGLMREDNGDRVVVQRSQDITAEIQSWGCTIIYPNEDDVLEVNGCQFAFWNTDHSDYYAMTFVDYNECSLCCTMSYGEEVMQFTGDIGTIACGKYYDKLYKCNIFKANHHACGYAVVPRFMSAMCPDIVITMGGSNIIYSTNPTIQARFATLTTGLQQWCEDEFVPNFITGVMRANIYMTISKNGFKFDSPARRCVRADEGIPVEEAG